MMDPTAAKLAALRALSGSLYTEHVRKQGTLATVEVCACSMDGADDSCDVGCALERMRLRELVRVKERHL